MKYGGKWLQLAAATGAFVFFSHTPAYAQAKKKIVILDLKMAGIEADEAKTLRSTLGGILAKSVTDLGHEVMSPADIQAIIGLERLKDLVGCESDSSCLTELGGALGADLIIGGSLGKLGEKYNLTLSLIDNNSAKTRGRFQGSAGTAAALTGTVQRGVAVLFERKKEVRTTGMLVVKTEPPGASITVDKKPMGTSPISVNMDAGDHEIKAQLDNLSGTGQVFIKPGEVARLLIRLTTPPVALRVNTAPPDASLYIDGKKMGLTPFMSEDIPSGTRSLRIELDGYAPQVMELELSTKAYDASGREPFEVETTLRKRWPVEPGLSVGMVTDLAVKPEGVTPQFELTLDVASHLQLGAAYALPGAALLNLRPYFYRGTFQVGAVIQSAFFSRHTPEGTEPVPTGISVGGGLTFGLAFDLPVGSVGANLETTYLYDLDFDSFVLPINLNIYWRMQ